MLGTTTQQSFVAANPIFPFVELYTLTLASGTVYHWNDADVNLTVGGTVYTSGGGTSTAPAIRRGNISWAMGLETSTLSVELLCQPGAVFGSTPIAQAAAAGALKGSTLLVERLMMPTWGDTSIGKVWLFFGDVGKVNAQPDLVTCEVESAVARVRNRVFPPKTITPDVFPFLPGN